MKVLFLRVIIFRQRSATGNIRNNSIKMRILLRQLKIYVLFNIGDFHRLPSNYVVYTFDKFLEYFQNFPGYFQNFWEYFQNFREYFQNFPGYFQNFPGYFQNFSGYFQHFPGYFQNFSRYFQNFPEYFQNFPRYFQNFWGYYNVLANKLLRLNFHCFISKRHHSYCTTSNPIHEFGIR